MKNAFSLMELMVVVIILGMLAMFVLPKLSEKSDKAKINITCIQMKSVGRDLKMYKIDTSTFPSTSEGLNLLRDKNYFDESQMPKDAWNNEFIYTSAETGFELISKGPNQSEGGSDDIYYSKCLSK